MTPSVTSVESSEQFWRICEPCTHCFTRFQKRKTTLMLFNRQFECKGIIKQKNKIVKFVRLF